MSSFFSSEAAGLIDAMFDLDEALTQTTYFSTDDNLLQEDIQSKLKADPETLWVSKLPVVDAGSGGAAVGCSICMEGFRPGRDGLQIPCGHVYHDDCIATWVAMYDSCPLCRCKVSVSSS